MNLFGKVAIIGLIVIVLAAGVIALSAKVSGAKPPINATAAQTFILGYMKQTYPTADVYPINVTPSKLANNSWDIFVGVVYNASSSCPTIEIEDFDYPAVNILPRTDNIYAENCTIYTNGNQRITIPAAAIVASYNSSSVAKGYVREYGYPNVSVKAKFFDTTNSTPLGTLQNVWLVNYSTIRSNYVQYVVLNQYGFPIGNYTVSNKAG
jgi:hypothetical protein